MALPLPVVVADVGPGGGIVTSMQGQNALTLSNLENQIKASEAQYAPWTNYANAASKIAYQQFVGPQSIAAILSNPATRGLLTQQQQNALISEFSRQMGSGNVLSRLPVPGGMMPGYTQNVMTQSMQIPPSNPMVKGMPIPFQQQNQGNNDAYGDQTPATPQEVQNRTDQAWNQAIGGIPATPAQQRAASLTIPGTMGGQNAAAGQAATEEAIKTGATTEAAILPKEWQENYTESKKAAAGAQNLLPILEKLKSDYDELGSLQRGRLGGKFPAWSSARQDFDKSKSALVDATARATQTGHIGIADREANEAMKLDTGLTREAFERQYQFGKGLYQRFLEKQTFDYHAAIMKPPLTPQQADILWNYYINQRPFFNQKIHRINEKNLNSWEDFLTPKKIAEAFSPRLQKANMKTEYGNKQNANKAPSMEIWIPMMKPRADGSGYDEYEITPESMDEALKKGYKRKK